MPAKKRQRATRREKLLKADGALCLTFVNAGRAGRPAVDSWDGLLAWAAGFGALEPAVAKRLAAVAERPSAAVDAARRAETLRRRLERIFEASWEGARPSVKDLDLLNAELRQVMAARRLVAGGDGYRWTWDEIDEDDIARVLRPVLLSAADVLTTGELSRVRRCSGEGCGIFFLANSPGKPRKWCGPACRSRKSTRGHYARVLKPLRAKERRASGGARRVRPAGKEGS